MENTQAAQVAVAKLAGLGLLRLMCLTASMNGRDFLA